MARHYLTDEDVRLQKGVNQTVSRLTDGAFFSGRGENRGDQMESYLTHVEITGTGAGAVTGKEVTWDLLTTSWEDVENGFVWDPSAEDGLPYLQPTGSYFYVGTVYPVYETYPEDDTQTTNNWVFYTGDTTDPFPHPFKVRPLGGDAFVIGWDRGESFRAVKDIIDIYDRDGSLLYSIEKTEPENVLSGSDKYIYYRITRDAAGAQPWTATPLFSADWPPIGADSDGDALYVPIAYTIGSDGIGQLQFSDIRVMARQFQPSFAAFHHNAGVTILAGTVREADATHTVAGATVPNGGTSSAWVEVVSAPDAAPVVTGTVQVGAFPGYTGVAAGTLTRNYKLGSFTGNDIWMPTHEGDLFLGTEYQPDVHADAQYDDAQSYKFLAGSSTSVGAAEDLFFDGREQGLSVLGGDVEEIVDVGELKLGGKTADTDQVLLTGASKVGSNLVLTNLTRSLDTEKGLTQDLTDTPNADITIALGDVTAVSITEGPGIDANLVGADYTITSLLVDADGVTVTLGAAGAAHTVQANYPEIWAHLLEGSGIDATVGGNDVTVKSLLQDADGVTVTLGGAGAAHTVQANYPELWAHVLAGDNITLNKVGDDVTINSTAVGTEGPGIDITANVITSLLDDDGNGVTVTDGAAGAAHVVAIDYPSLWGRLVEGSGIQLSIAGDDYTVTSVLDGSQSITVTTGIAGEPHTVEVSHQMSVTSDANGVKLVNDETTPFPYHVYAFTEGIASANKGWHPIQAMVADTDTIEDTSLASSDPLELSVINQMSITDDSSGIKLVGDSLNPGAYAVYGCGSGGNNVDKDWLATTEVTVVTDMRLDSSNDLQIKTRTIRVLNPGTESAWTTVTDWATTDCP